MCLPELATMDIDTENLDGIISRLFIIIDLVVIQVIFGIREFKFPRGSALLVGREENLVLW